jgi:hypothetical protein
MIATNSRVACWDAFDEHWAAELTTAAYLVALRHGATSQWLELQLELWRALSATVAKGEGEFTARCEPSQLAFSAEDFLAELAYVAYRVALPYGRRRSFLDLELELYQTFRRIVECAEREWAAPPMLRRAPA